MVNPLKVYIGPYRKNRAVRVRIDEYDTWGMDSTLALLIIPMLKQLKATKHGSPSVDDADVPEHLRSTAAPRVAREYDTDDNFFKRWDWVMDEMIWAFETMYLEENEEGRPYYIVPYGATEPVKPLDWFDEDGKPFEPDYMNEDARRTRGKIDKPKLDAFNKRIQHAFTLFGKHFMSLWD